MYWTLLKLKLVIYDDESLLGNTFTKMETRQKHEFVTKKKGS